MFPQKSHGKSFRRRCILAIVGICIAASAFAAMRWRQKPSALDGIVFEKRIVQAGPLIVGMEHRERFIGRNIGTQTVKIENIVPSCSCSGAADFPKAGIEPSAAATIDVSFVPSVGEARVAFLVTTSDKRKSVLEITYEGYSDVAVSESEIDFGMIVKGSPRERSVDISQDVVADARLKLRVAGTAPDWIRSGISVSVPEPLPARQTDYVTIAGGRQAPQRPLRKVGILKVAVTADAPVGKFREPIFIIASDKHGERRITVFCSGSVREEVRALPSSIVLTPSQSGQSVEIQLTSVQFPFTITGCGSADFEISEVRPTAPANSVTVTIKSKTPSSEAAKTLRLNLNHPSVHFVDVPVRFARVN